MPLASYAVLCFSSPQLDVIVGYPIDWFIFGKRASAMASAALGVRAAEAEYADLMRRRVAERP